MQNIVGITIIIMVSSPTFFSMQLRKTFYTLYEHAYMFCQLALSAQFEYQSSGERLNIDVYSN